MALETGTYISDLVATNPTSTDAKSQGDDHLRLVKTALKNSLAGFSGLVLAVGTEAQGATVNDFTATISPAPAAYTSSMLVVFKATHTNTGGATLQVNALGSKSLFDVDGEALAAGFIASGALVLAYYDGTAFYCMSANGLQTVPTPSTGDSSTKIATTQFVARDFAPLASAALTGSPTAPTPPAVANTRIATAEFVLSVAYASVTLPVLQGQAVFTDSSSLLAVASYRSIRNTGGAGNLYLLPDARTLNIGFTYEFYNDNTCVLMTNDGGYIGSSNLPAGLCRVWLTSNSTQAGTWAASAALAMTSLSAVNLSGTAVTITSSLTNLNPEIVQIPLDSTRTLLIYSTTKASASSTSGVWAVVASSSFAVGRPVVTIGTPVKVSGGANIGTEISANIISACVVSTDVTAIGWSESNNSTVTPKVALLTTSGTSVSASTPQSLATAYAGASYSGNSGQPAVVLVSTSSTALFAAYFNVTDKTYYLRGITVGSGSLTLNTEYTGFATSGMNTNQYAGLTIAAFSSTLIGIAGLYDYSTTNTGRVVFATVSGANIATVGTPVSLPNSQHGSVIILKLSATTGIVACSSVTNSLYSFTLSGTVPTFSAALSNAASNPVTAIATSSTAFSVAYGTATGYNFTVSSNVVSAASPATFTTISANHNSMMHNSYGAYLNGTAIVFAHKNTLLNVSTLVTRGTITGGIVPATPSGSDRYLINTNAVGTTTVTVTPVLPSFTLN